MRVAKLNQKNNNKLNYELKIHIKPLCFFLTLIFVYILAVIGCNSNGESDINEFFTPTIVEGTENEIFVPKTLEECHLELDRGLSTKVKEFLKRVDEQHIEKGLNEEEQRILDSLSHFGLAMWIRNYWGLWQDGELAEYFINLGITHPDNMSGVILESYVAKVKGEPYPLEEIASAYRLQYQRRTQPDDYIDPQTGQKIAIVESEKQFILEDGICVHVGVNHSTGEIWYYEFEKGWYKPTEERIKFVEGNTKGTIESIGTY